ncbi:MAG: hypothetical protein JHC85_02935 [Chthoniobacterales bacterium]|nr:hypothetical protein [Chthoniobacterales bacterium]
MKNKVSGNPKRWPDFLIIGAAKAGTTALFKAVGRHPRIFSPALKEPRFFAYAERPPVFSGPASSASPPPPVTEESAYFGLFKDCPATSKTFEASTVYLSSEQAQRALPLWIRDTVTGSVTAVNMTKGPTLDPAIRRPLGGDLPGGFVFGGKSDRARS